MSSGFKHHIKYLTTKRGPLHSTELRDRKGDESRNESHGEQSPASYLSTLAPSLHCNLKRTPFIVHSPEQHTFWIKGMVPTGIKVTRNCRLSALKQAESPSSRVNQLLWSQWFPCKGGKRWGLLKLPLGSSFWGKGKGLWAGLKRIMLWLKFSYK